MSVTELMTTVRSAGIQLEARGDRLRVDAPLGAITAELRNALVRHKAEILAALPRTSSGFVTLLPDAKTGFAPTLPVEAIELVTDLSFRGFRQSVTAQGEYRIEPKDRLTSQDLSAIARWRQHLPAMIAYEAPQIS